MAIRQPDTVGGPHPGLLDWLASREIDYELHEHPETFTARETARAEHVDPSEFAKTLAVVADDGRQALLVLRASDQLDLSRAARALDAKKVRLLLEDEMQLLDPISEVGTIPPIGVLMGVPTIADHGIAQDREITFNAGSHRFCVHVERAQWQRASDVRFADLAARPDGAPAWERA